MYAQLLLVRFRGKTQPTPLLCFSICQEALQVADRQNTLYTTLSSKQALKMLSIAADMIWLNQDTIQKWKHTVQHATPHV